MGVGRIREEDARGILWTLSVEGGWNVEFRIGNSAREYTRKECPGASMKPRSRAESGGWWVQRAAVLTANCGRLGSWLANKSWDQPLKGCNQTSKGLGQLLWAEMLICANNSRKNDIETQLGSFNTEYWNPPEKWTNKIRMCKDHN